MPEVAGRRAIALSLTGLITVLATLLGGCRTPDRAPRLLVSDAYVQLADGHAPVVYLTITNSGDAVDRLVAVTSPAADSVRIDRFRAGTAPNHARHVIGLGLPPHQTVRIEPPYGLQLSLVGPHRLVPGRDISFALRFAHSKPASVAAQVVRAGGGPIATD